MSRRRTRQRPPEPLDFTITIEEVLADLHWRPAPPDRTADDPGTAADGHGPARRDHEPSRVPTRPRAA